MAEDEPDAQRTNDAEPGDLVGEFRLEQLITSSGDVRVFRARDDHVGRSVLLHVARAQSADALMEDARRLSAVSHPGLVAVLAAGRTGDGGYTAVAELDARPISGVASLSEGQAARIGIDISGAIQALAESGLRAPVDAETVLVVRTAEGVRGVLDPFRAELSGTTRLTAPDTQASLVDLAGLVERVAPAGSETLTRALGGVHSRSLRSPDELASALAPLVAAPKASRRRPALVAAGCLALAAIAVAVVAVVAHERSDEPAAHPAHATAPALVGHIVRRIPLGMAKGETLAAFTTAGDSVWIATSSGRILRVDAATNQVVGSPSALGKGHYLWALIASGGMLYGTDEAGWLLRIDPATARITGRRHLAPSLTAMEAVNGVLWIVAATAGGSQSSVIRVDARSLRTIGKPVRALPRPLHIQVRGSHAWVLGGDSSGQVVRVDVKSGERKSVWIGPSPTSMALAGNTLWITDRFNGTVAALDAEHMTFRREAVVMPASALGISHVGSDLWVAASSLIAGGSIRIERLDARTGKRAGRALAVAPDGRRMEVGIGSVWLATASDLVRIAPAARSELEPSAPPGASPRAVVPGPLARGRWHTVKVVTPFTFSVPAFKWLSLAPGRDAAWLQAAGSRYAELDVNVPRQVFKTDKGPVVAVGSPASLLAVLRKNPRFLVGPVRHVTIGGRPALQFELRARHATLHPAVCGPHPCVLLFPVSNATIAIPTGDLARVALLSSRGHTVAIFEGGDGVDRVALAQTATVLRTLRFTP